MVLRLKAWESRSLPGFLSTKKFIFIIIYNSAGWSSPVARQAHNLKVAGSNPAPATKIKNYLKSLTRLRFYKDNYLLETQFVI